MFRSIKNRTAVGTLIAVQFVCAINWYSVSSVFSLIASDFHQNVSGLGLITSTFVLGVAGFQLPAGLLASKYGSKKTLILGMLLISFSSILVGFGDQVTELTLLRFVGGVGEACIFGPGVILIMRYFREGSEGLGIGLFGGAFDLGAIVGISGWAVLGGVLGWRISVVAGGIIGLGMCALLVLLVPKDPPVGGLSLRLSELKGILFNKWLLLVSAGLVVSNVSFGISSYFMVYFLEDSLGTGAALAGAVAGASVFASVLASPFLGRSFDRNPSPKLTLIVFCLASAGGLAIAGLNSVYASLISGVVVGVATSGAFIFGVSIARTIGGTRREYEALGLSWINSIALLGGVIMPLVFSGIAAGFGYPLAWALGGAILVGVTVPLLRLRSEAGT